MKNKQKRKSNHSRGGKIRYRWKSSFLPAWIWVWVSEMMYNQRMSRNVMVRINDYMKAVFNKSSKNSLTVL